MLGIVTGLAAEARMARDLGLVAAGGGTPAGAARAAARLVATGADALLSFGLAGGLDPALPAGSLLVPATVLGNGVAWPTDAALRDRLGPGVVAPLAATSVAVASVADKAALRRATGAAAVDLESGEVAAVAARHGLPFAVLRAVCDPAGRALPPAALVALDGAGGIGLWRVARAVLRAPGQLPALLALAGDAAAARRALVGRVRDLRAAGGLVA